MGIYKERKYMCVCTCKLLFLLKCLRLSEDRSGLGSDVDEKDEGETHFQRHGHMPLDFTK